MPSYREGPSCGTAPTPAVHQPSLALLLVLELPFILRYLPPTLHLRQSLLCTSPHFYICLRYFSFPLHALIIALFVFPSDKQLVTTL